MRRHRRRIDAHGAEFGHFENAVALTDAVGPVDGGAGRGSADAKGYKNSPRPQNCPNSHSHSQIENPFHSQQSGALKYSETVQQGVFTQGLPILQ